MPDWNDDRLDDLATREQTTAQAVSYLALKVNTLETQMKDLRERAREQTSNKFNWYVIGATAISSPLTAIVVYLISRK